MKRMVWIFLAVTGFSCTLQAQERAEIEKLVSKKIDTVALSGFNVSAQASTSILVLDYRADTTKIGYRENHGLRRTGRETARNFFPYQLEKGTAAGWAGLLSSTLSANGLQGPHYVAVLRNFWVTQYESELTARDRPDVFSRKKHKITFAADYFMEHNGLWYPFARIDTSFIGAVVELDDDSHVITQLLDWHAVVFKKTDPERVKKRTGYTLGVIREKNTMPQAPILASGVVYEKGIYQNFQEFLNNAPSLKYESEVDKKKKAPQSKMNFFRDTLTGERLLTKEIWGYCDGKTIFINYDNYYYPAARAGNTFEILGATIAGNRSWEAAPSITGSGIASGSFYFYFPMQLDMRQGEIL